MAREELNEVLKKTFESNMNSTTAVLSVTRASNYTNYLESVLRQAILGDVSESTEENVSLQDCAEFLYFSLFEHCEYYVPVMDQMLQVFTTLCRNRGLNGMVMLDFAKVSKKQ